MRGYTDAMDTPPSQPAELTSLARSADAYHELARRLEAAGQAEAAEFAYAAAAALDLRNPELQAAFGGPFNGQEERCRIVLDLLASIRPAAIVETGTFRGTTTEWLAARFDGPIYSCELDRRFFLQAREKLMRFTQVRVSLADSRAFLRDLLLDLPKDQPVLFYLDAHWNEDLPLVEEARLIVEQAPLAVIMIDDFRVPFDAGYSWDDYGPGKRISLDLLHEFKDRCSFAFPSLAAAEETGAKRGLCVMAGAESLREAIATQRRLRQADWREWRVIEAEIAAENASRTRDDAVARRDALAAERDEIVAERDALVAERDEILAQRDALAAERNEIVVQRDAFAAECNAIAAQRDAFAAERNEIAARRDAFVAERDEIAAQRDALAAENDEIAAQRDALAAERDETLAQLARTRERSDALVNQLASRDILFALLNDRLDARLAELRQSRSWRVTAALRTWEEDHPLNGLTVEAKLDLLDAALCSLSWEITAPFRLARRLLRRLYR